MPDENNRRPELFLTFAIGAEKFALPILKVLEIIQNAGITRVPHVPRCIRGVINLRGGVVPVIDLGVKFGMPPREIGPATCIVIVETSRESQRSVMGVVADSVSEVVALSAADIEPPPEFGTTVKSEFLAGLGKLGKGFALILAADRVLAREELLAEILATAGLGAAAELPASRVLAAV